MPHCIRPDGQRSRLFLPTAIQPIGTMSTVGLGFVIEVVSSRSGVWWADIICICIIDYTSPRPVEKASVRVLLHLEECVTSEVRVCGRKGTSYSLS